MKRDLFRRYVWLIDVIRHAKKITFEEISNLWKNSPLNEDHSPLALRTFHNHREAIEHLFGIRILCDRSDHNRYYVADDNAMSPTKLKVWMLQTLSVSNIISKTSNVENRIVVDVTPEENFGLTAIINAMKQNHLVKLSYSLPVENNRTELMVEPYCVRFWNRTWYLLARTHDSAKMVVFDLGRVISVENSDESFVYDDKFTPYEFFRNYYGMDIDPTLAPVPIRLRVGGRTRDIIRTQPLHQSQKELMVEYSTSVFEYYFVPSDDFKKTILSMGTDVEVLSPTELRNDICQQIKRMAQTYN